MATGRPGRREQGERNERQCRDRHPRGRLLLGGPGAAAPARRGHRHQGRIHGRDERPPDLREPSRSRRGGRDRLRPRTHLLSGHPRVLLPDPRPDDQRPPGQRLRLQLPLRDLLHERRAAPGRRGHDRRRRRQRPVARQGRHRDQRGRHLLGGRARAPGLPPAVPQRVHLPLPAPGLEAATPRNCGLTRPLGPRRHAALPVAQAGSGSLGRVFDHVGIAVADLAASERFYRTVLGVLGVEPSHADSEIVEWEDWDILATDREHPVTRGLHAGFRARDRTHVDAFWQAGVDAGYRDDGAPGPRTQYGPTYYGGFLLDPDGNSVEAVHGAREHAVPNGSVDHLWIRVRDLQASRRFYTTIAPDAGLRLTHDEPDRVQLSGTDSSFSLVRDERPPTEYLHLAFPATEDATVRAFHAAALAAGYEDHGAPGERAIYHPGYYGAFVLDPDGHNVEVVNHNPG